MNRLLLGDSREQLKNVDSNSVDAVVTDPPYGLSKEPNIVEVLTKWLAGGDYDHGHGGFMGKAWDSFVPHPDIWKEVYRVLKPGGYALVFAGTRTQDLMTIALRLAGFEVRDVIEWLYFSGFPKSMDVGKAFDKAAGAEREVVGERYVSKDLTRNGIKGDMHVLGNAKGTTVDITAPATDLAKQWDGWGTALKPAHEPIILVRKPLIGTVAANVERYGVGALNIDGCRIGRVEGDRTEYGVTGNQTATTGKNGIYGSYAAVAYTPDESGRFPANCITTDEDAFYSPYFNVSPQEVSKKAAKKDRNGDWRGEEIEGDEKTNADGFFEGRVLHNEDGSKKVAAKFKTAPKANFHPTVKPTDLMAWLVRLVTPPGGVVLDPFAGSGTTLVAAKREGYRFIGIEREPEYMEIIEARTGEEQEW